MRWSTDGRTCNAPILIGVLQENMHVMYILIPTSYSGSQPVGRMS